MLEKNKMMQIQRNVFFITSTVLIGSVIFAFARRQSSKQKASVNSSISSEEGSSTINASEALEIASTKSNQLDRRRILCRGTITVAYASTTGTCESLAQRAAAQLVLAIAANKHSHNNNNKKKNYSHVQICPIGDVDWWDELLNEEEEAVEATSNTEDVAIVIFILPTWTNGSFPPNAISLEVALQELSTDWRVAPKCLANKLSIALFGMGSTAYDSSTFNRPSKTIVTIMRNKLGAKLLKGGMGLGDDSVGDFRHEFEVWLQNVTQQIAESPTTRNNNDQEEEGLKQSKPKRVVVRGKKPSKAKEMHSTSCCSTADHDETTNSSSCCQSNDNSVIVSAIPKEEEEEEESKEVLYDDDSSSAYDSLDEEDMQEPDVIDLEDLGVAMRPLLVGDKQHVPKEMVTPKQAAALKKEGYKLIGTHSAVKLCRWTKHQLRGRGGCYKHSFYGITSYQCMEATPSLACANKCVFCWRHHKNPVGKEWRWKTDDPHFIVAEAVQAHVGMIKEARGIPGVMPQRYQEALTVRHCALSLVGEPIMYPRINELLADLHSRNISSFLVTNGQHPAAIETLIPVTQLYVSVDAPTEQTLIDIDRPLFKDAWDRLRMSLTLLKHKRQRTVARLTVVKGWNFDEIQGYAELIALGHVSLVEVKGVTFCGKSDASNLNMSNSPWHHEVVALTSNLQQELAKMTAAGGPDAPPLYGIACEHKHSCCIVLARVDQFAIDDPATGKRKWRTWIDFDKFLELSRRHEQDSTFKLDVEDYIADTPDWATFGSEEEGFDPTDRRHRRKGKAPLYTKFDSRGVPTHGWDGTRLAEDEIQRLNQVMDGKIAEMGSALSVVKELGDGAKSVVDPSLMFRGLVVSS